MQHLSQFAQTDNYVNIRCKCIRAQGISVFHIFHRRIHGDTHHGQKYKPLILISAAIK